MGRPLVRQIWLGQIAMYMWHAKCKYGFMSTYNETVFLKQDVDPSDPNKYALWYSDAIRHNIRARPVGGGNPSAAPYRNCVSLKECFLFLGLEIQAGPLAS